MFNKICDILIVLLVTYTACVIANDMLLTIIFSAIGAKTIYNYTKSIINKGE